jgi:hypothetical protein
MAIKFMRLFVPHKYKYICVCVCVCVCILVNKVCLIPLVMGCHKTWIMRSKWCMQSAFFILTAGKGCQVTRDISLKYYVSVYIIYQNLL